MESTTTTTTMTTSDSLVAERVKLAKLCSSRDWSKAIRVLDTLLSRSCVIQDVCNRAFCYSQLELHKHVIKDCDKAIQIDPSVLQPYIMKGRALSSLGRKEEALLVWEQGYGYAVRQSVDLKQMLELEELLTSGKQTVTTVYEDSAMDYSTPVSVSEVHSLSNGALELSKSTDITDTCNSSNEKCSKPDNVSVISTDTSEVCSKPRDTTEMCQKSTDKPEICSKSSVKPEICSKSSVKAEIHSKDTTEMCQKSTDKPEICSKSSVKPEICSKSSVKAEIHSKESNGNKASSKVSSTGVSKTVSISLDLRLSRGIAKVNEGKYAQAIAVFDKILKEDPTYPEALIGRGTAYAFQRELHAAITDFTEAIKANPLAGEAWKRRGQARAALGESVEARVAHAIQTFGLS